MKYLLGIALLTAAAGGCTTVTVQHKVDPIYITVDINIRVQEELGEFFDYEKARSNIKVSEVAAESKGEKK